MVTASLPNILYVYFVRNDDFHGFPYTNLMIEYPDSDLTMLLVQFGFTLVVFFAPFNDFDSL